MKFDFFRGNECEQYLFYRVPQVLFTDDEFRYISSEAKLLYGFLLDRTALSAKNKWTDEDGKVYVYFTQDEAKEKLNIGTGKATKIFSELDEIGLIIRIRQGQGNPCKIYVMNFAKPLSRTQTSENQKSEKSKMEVLNSEKDNLRLTKSESLKQIKRKSRLPKNGSQDLQKSEVLNSEKDSSRPPKIESQDFQKSECNNTENSHTENSHIYLSSFSADRLNDGVIEYQQCIDDVKEQISYDSLLHQGIDKNYLDFIVSLIADVYINKNIENTYSINNVSISAERVIKRYSLLDDTHICYVTEKLIQSFKNQQIKNIRKYTISCLYNAPVMIDIDIDSQLAYKGD
ncbi:replication initiator protein A [uncultured Ruminococcus sp.]|uniref:replication initiator protein A n=1 Tax=uncultured Ruminococcus sp. TaxID=165186 RepID=UPI00266F39EE|nr:replication initiator protein A [uncultured Ruminococcus sp.]